MTTARDQPHGNDVVSLAVDQAFTDYFIQFVATLDPNGGLSSGSDANKTALQWPRYDQTSRQMLRVMEGEEVIAVGRDDAREEAMEAVAALSLKYPV